MSGRDAIEKALAENGVDSGIHSWRCEYPDRYGPCTCLEELVDDLNAVAGDIAAAAWDTAVSVMRYEDGTPVELVTVINPYRATEQA